MRVRAVVVVHLSGTSALQLLSFFAEEAALAYISPLLVRDLHLFAFIGESHAKAKKCSFGREPFQNI